MRGMDMKIIPESLLNSRNIVKKQKAEEQTPASDGVSRSSDFDKITIGAAEKTGIPDEQFVSQLKKSILAEIQAGASEYKLEGLKKQIALNEYDINVPDITKRIMLDNPEANYES